MDTMNEMRDKVSDKSWYYLKHSASLPEWKQETGELGYDETLEQLTAMHLGNCNRSAIILNELMATQLYSIFKRSNKPVFYGKDVLSESFIGYRVFGNFPTSMLSRIRHFHRTGITEWWQKYFRWFTLLQTELDFLNFDIFNGSTIKTRQSKNTTGVYVLCLIPVIGLLFSTIVFIFYDCNAFGATMFCFWSILQDPRKRIYEKLKITKPCRTGSLLESTDLRSSKRLSCIFCVEFSVKNINDLKLHIINNHTEHFLLEALVSHQGLVEFQVLCKRTLDLEIQSQTKSNNEYEQCVFSCPYKCVDVELRNEDELKLHIFELHQNLLIEKLQCS